ncbi:MAG: sugar-binding domain-containing protein [Luteolibacter sp.]|uniref:glycoside hydrolase family 2 protein n=1 Tax=Luteolibacter sp. TaxID=1962973 RepID=UPI003263865B
MKRSYSTTEFLRTKSAQLVWKSLFLVSLSGIAEAAEWAAVKGGMMTQWGREVTAEKVWQEYPRPQMERADWTNLNGLWDYAVTAKDETTPASWAGQILVPFCPESSLSGVGRLIEPTEALWYKRPLPGLKAGKRTILNFEAVDYTTTVWVNGKRIGSHTGGFTPFSYDITPALKADGNELLVRVDDATEGYQLHGKQKLKNEGIWYTRVTGIWQSVWLENVSPRFINDLDYTCDIKSGNLTVSAKLSGKAVEGEKLRVSASFGGKEVTNGSGASSVTLKIAEPKLWSPAEPNLYDLKIELLDGDGKVADEIKSYTALREFGKIKDSNGNWRFTLNGKSIFHWGPLDQGWWPDGLLTPPSEAAMISDIDFLKAAGFNMIRKHIKVEPRRYYAHCDKIGMLMWQDQVSMGFGPETLPKGSNPPWTRMAPNPKDGEWPDEAHEQYVTEYKRMVDHLRDVPCIAVWSPFNEAWGQHRTMEVGKMAMEYDNTRPINIASGGNFWPVGDIADEHRYPDPGFPFEDKRFNDYVKVVGEFGGHGMPIEGHLWNKDSPNWGYGGLPKNLDEWKERYSRSIEVLAGLRKRGVCAGVYTQTTDVEVEINGLRTYDRMNKVDPAWLKPLSDMLLATPDMVKLTEIVPTSENSPQVAKFTTAAPAEGWEKTMFDDSSWSQGQGGFGTAMTPGTHIGTEWNSSDIWIRREVQLAKDPAGQLVLRVFHDEDAEVFLNGTQIAAMKGHVTTYIDFPIQQKDLLKAGRNVIAVHCHQTSGGQFIDVGIVAETAN